MIDYSSMVMSRGPTNYWRLNEATGVFTAYDLIGSNNGTYSNPPEPNKHVAASPFINDDPYAVSFEGNVDMGHNLSWWTEPFLLEFWYRMYSTTVSVVRIYSVANTAESLSIFFQAKGAYGNLTVKLVGSPGYLYIRDSYNDDGSNWHNCMVVLKNKTMWFYRDGSLVASFNDPTWGGMLYYGDSNLYLPANYYFAGLNSYSDEVAIYGADWYSDLAYKDWWNYLGTTDRNLFPVM